MKRTYLIVLGILLVAGIILLLHDSEKKETQNIPIGIIAPLTGNRADAGEYMRNALTLFQETNEKRASNYTLILEDDRYSNESAVTVTKNLLETKGVRYFIGPYGTSQVLAVAPLTEQAHAVLMTPGAQADSITDAGEYVFRLIHNAKQETPIFGAFIAKKMKGDTVHFLAIKNEFAASYLKNITPILEAHGKTVVLVDEFLPTDIDFKTQLLKVKSSHPTDIFPIATPKQMGLILRQANELGIQAQFYYIGVEGPDLLNVGGDTAEGLYYPYSYDTDATAETKRFAELYQKRFQKDPDAVAANTYDALILLDHCISQVGNIPEEVKNCLYRTKDFNGTSGTFSIYSKGDVEKPIIIKTVKNGKYVKYDE